MKLTRVENIVWELEDCGFIQKVMLSGAADHLLYSLETSNGSFPVERETVQKIIQELTHLLKTTEQYFDQAKFTAPSELTNALIHGNVSVGENGEANIEAFISDNSKPVCSFTSCICVSPAGKTFCSDYFCQGCGGLTKTEVQTYLSDLEKVIDPDRISYLYYPTHKIRVIKAIRERTGLGLKEAKDLSENWYNFFDARLREIVGR